MASLSLVSPAADMDPASRNKTTCAYEKNVEWVVACVRACALLRSKPGTVQLACWRGVGDKYKLRMSRRIRYWN